MLNRALVIFDVSAWNSINSNVFHRDSEFLIKKGRKVESGDILARSLGVLYIVSKIVVCSRALGCPLDMSLRCHILVLLMTVCDLSECL